MIKMITGFVVNKIIAVYLGPSGMALMSQYQNFITIANSLATGGIASGVVKYTAEYNDNDSRLPSFLSSSIKFTVSTSLLVGFLIAIFFRQIGEHIFYSASYNYLILLFACTIVFFALQTLLVSILNGYNEVRKYTIDKIAGSIISLIFTGGLAYLYGVKGALIALTVNQAILLIVTIVLVVKSKWFHIRNFMQKVEQFHIRNLLKFTFMAMLFGILTPIVQIGIRNYIAGHADLSSAGYWDGMTKLSQAYLTLITTTISVYFLPKYSKLKDKYLIKKEIFRGYKILVPLLLTGFVFIFLIRFFIIEKLYSREFYPMASLFLPQLISDFFQMTSWLVSYLLIAKAMLKLMVITQVSFAAINYGLSVLMFNRFGIEGVIWGAVIRYILYSLLIAYLFRDYLTAKKTHPNTE